MFSIAQSIATGYYSSQSEYLLEETRVYTTQLEWIIIILILIEVADLFITKLIPGVCLIRSKISASAMRTARPGN